MVVAPLMVRGLAGEPMTERIPRIGLSGGWRCVACGDLVEERGGEVGRDDLARQMQCFYVSY